MMSNTFPRHNRLTKPAEFTHVFRRPELNVSAGPLRIRARKNKLCGARLGVVVPRKGTRRAVRRNRIKRIVRDQFRTSRTRLPALDMVVQVFEDTGDTRLRSSLDNLFEQISKLHTSS